MWSPEKYILVIQFEIKVTIQVAIRTPIFTISRFQVNYSNFRIFSERGNPFSGKNNFV